MTSPRFLRRAFLFALPLMLLAARPAMAGLMADSTMSDGWKLANGLEVRVRHVPGAAGVAIAVAYRAGTAYEPPMREGLSTLLAELEYTAPAGDIPERTREEMASLRPLGWGVQVNERLVVLTEIAAPDRFPGVLRQVAQRMRGVTPALGDLERATASVKADLGQRQFGRADLALYYRVRELALGATDEQILRRASGEGLKGVTLKEATAKLKQLYVPANACLSIAGDFGAVDVHALVEREFGAIPAGVAQPEPAAPVLKPFVRASGFAGLDHATSVLGLFAPAIEDSLHPSFYLAMVVGGPFISNKLGRPSAPLTSRFQYSLFDEPDLVRFYLEPKADESDPTTVPMQMAAVVDPLAEAQMERDVLESVKRSVAWLLGGALPKPVKDQMKRQPGALGTLATGMASRVLWKGDAFWDDYRARFEATLRGHNTFANWMTDPAHQAVLLLTPKP